MEKATLNGKIIDIKYSKETTYFKKDLDLDLLTDEEKLDKKVKPEWYSLMHKGKLIIDTYLKDILPNIVKVHGIEIPIEIKNPVGDKIIGYIDLLCDYKTDKGIKTILFDHKTSSKPYPKNSIQTSQQLSLYTYDKEIELVGYIVANKDIKKPKIGVRKGETYAQIQVMYENIADNIQEKFITNADMILHKIKHDEFNKNSALCHRWYGKPCPYFELCYNGDESKLFKKEK